MEPLAVLAVFSGSRCERVTLCLWSTASIFLQVTASPIAPLTHFWKTLQDILASYIQ